MTPEPWKRDGFKNRSAWLRRHMGAAYGTFACIAKVDLDTAEPEDIIASVLHHAPEGPREVYAHSLKQSAAHHRTQGQFTYAAKLEIAAEQIVGREAAEETTA